jgi:hypothetical protein
MQVKEGLLEWKRMFDEFSERIEVDYLEFFKSRVKIRSEMKQLRDTLQS